MTVANMSSYSPSEAAYQRIRSDIVFGRIEPGKKLTLERMKATYGVGIGTLRELFSRLSAEGLVIAQGQRGFEVPPVTAKGLQELSELRLLIEAYALRRSFAQGDMEWEGRVVSAHHKVDVAERTMLECSNLNGACKGAQHNGGPHHDGDDPKRDLALWKRYDHEFHQALISACGSSEMISTHSHVFDKYQRYQMVACCFRGQVSHDEHTALRHYALARDADGAVAVLEGHIRGCVEYTLATGAVA